MNEAYSDRIRREAVQILRCSASLPVPRNLRDIATDLWLIGPDDAYALARAAFVESLSAGNWREQRAEAEAKLKTGWRP